jgi:hypothetical protein
MPATKDVAGTVGAARMARSASMVAWSMSNDRGFVGSGGQAWLGIDLDPGANDVGGPCLTRPASRVSAWVIPTDEDQTIAPHTQRVLDDASGAHRLDRIPITRMVGHVLGAGFYG